MDDVTKFRNARAGGRGFARLRARWLVERRSSRWIIALAVILALLAALALAPALLFFRTPHPLYTAASRGDVILKVRAPGDISMMEYGTSFAIPGALAQVMVIPGQTVRKGAPLAALDATAAKAMVTGAEASASDAQAEVNAAQSAADQAQVTFSSASTALTAAQAGATVACGSQPADPTACASAQAAVAGAQAAQDAAQAQVAAAQTQQARAQTALDAAQSALILAQTRLAATALTAPHDGTVLAINGQVGVEITPGATPFITLADMSQPLATALASYRDVAAIEPGESVTLGVAQATGATTMRGIVTGVALLPSGSGDHLAYPIAIRIDPASVRAGARLLPGMSASITITTRVRMGVVTAPASAIAYARQAAPASGAGLLTAGQIKAALAQAQTLEAQAVAAGLDVAHDAPAPGYLIGLANGAYVAIPVVLGLTDGSRQEIIAGLAVGEKVVSGQRNPLFN